MWKFVLLLATAVCVAVPAVGAEVARSGDIVVEQAWSRATPPGATVGGVYATLRTTGKTADRLLKVESTAARSAELHTMSMDGGVMRMRTVAAIDVTPGRKTELTPGGLHVMLIGLHKPLVEGDVVSLTLTFEKAGRVEVEAKVGKAGALGADAGTSHSH